MKIFDYVRRYKWDLGVALEVEGHRYDSPKWNFHIIKAPQDCWYADPFILDITETEIIVLVEEYTYAIGRGRLAKLIIDKTTYSLKDSKIILDLPSHLSFPAILRLNEKIYIYPENSASGSCKLYEYNITSDNVAEICTISNQPFTDAIIADVFRQPTLFSTKLPDCNGNTIFIYESSQIIAGYKLRQTIKLSDNTARSAGNIFQDGNRIIRVAQNCNGGYGVGLVFQEVKQRADGNFEVKELFRKQPITGYEGMHTYNQYKGYTIVDLHTRRFPLLHNILKRVKYLF